MQERKFIKRAQFTLKVAEGIWRRIYEDDKGRYYIKFNGELLNVTYAKNDFIAI